MQSISLSVLGVSTTKQVSLLSPRVSSNPLLTLLHKLSLQTDPVTTVLLLSCCLRLIYTTKESVIKPLMHCTVSGLTSCYHWAWFEGIYAWNLYSGVWNSRLVELTTMHLPRVNYCNLNYVQGIVLLPLYAFAKETAGYYRHWKNHRLLSTCKRSPTNLWICRSFSSRCSMAEETS